MQLVKNNTFFKFIFFGGLNTIFAYSILALFLYLEYHYSIATLIASVISIFSGYFINKFFVFNSKKPKNILLYSLFWFTIYNLSIFIQYFLLEIIVIENLYFNSFIATSITVIVSFITNKYYFFKD